MDSRTAKAVDVVIDITKLVMTLATAIMGGFVAITTKKDAPTFDFTAWGADLAISFLLLGLSVLFGLVTLLMVTGELGSSQIANPSIYKARIRVPAGLQLITFGFGIGTFALGVPRWDWSFFS